jgi:hypothetical protein
MNNLKAIVSLYNLALRGKYEVTPEGAGQVQSILGEAQKVIQSMTQELETIKQEKENGTEADSE